MLLAGVIFAEDKLHSNIQEWILMLLAGIIFAYAKKINIMTL